MKFSIYQGNRQGARPYNQDRLAYSYSKDSLLLIIADGMGGHQHGELAAEMAIKILTEAFQRFAVPFLVSPNKFLNDHILQIHNTIDSYAMVNDMEDSPRTTIVAAVLQHGELYCAHVGDSRMYHFRDGKLLHRTEDHSVIQMLYRKGMIKFEELENHPEKNKIYNCLGGEKMPTIEIMPSHELLDGDTVLLCTDGLWSAMNDAEVNQFLHEKALSETIPKMLTIAEARMGDLCDNVSAVGVQWGDTKKLDSNRLFVSTVTMPMGQTTTIIDPVEEKPTLDEKIQVMKELTDEEIEKSIQEIQTAIRNVNRQQ